MKAKLATPVLIACAMLLTIGNGTGIYEHLFGIPKMLSSPIAYMETTNSDMGQPQKFWIPLHAMILLTLILSLVFNWKNKRRKYLILATFISYIYISIVSIFFARELFAFKEITDPAVFSEQTSRWILLSWHRPIIGLASVVLLMIAISRPATSKAPV